MDGQLVLTAGMLTTLTLELIKFAIRKYVVKDMEYDYPPAFYTMIVPFLTAVWGIILGMVGWADPVAFEPMVILQWALAIFVSTALYVLGVKPITTYSKKYEETKRMRDGIL